MAGTTDPSGAGQPVSLAAAATAGHPGRPGCARCTTDGAYSWHDPHPTAAPWDGARHGERAGRDERTEGRAVYAPGQLTTERPIPTTWQKTSMKSKDRTS